MTQEHQEVTRYMLFPGIVKLMDFERSLCQLKSYHLRKEVLGCFAFTSRTMVNWCIFVGKELHSESPLYRKDIANGGRGIIWHF